MISIFSRYLTITIAGLIITGVVFQFLPITVARAGAVLVLLLQIIVEVRTGHNQFLTSPLFLLGGITLIFLSFIPSVGFFSFIPNVAETPGITHPIFLGSIMLPTGDTFERYKNMDSFFGSNAELGFVIFGLACLAVHALIADRTKMPRLNNEQDFLRNPKIIYIFAVIALGLSIVNVVNFMSLKWGGLHLTT